MRDDPNEVLKRLLASPQAAAIKKELGAEVTARRRKAIDENEQAQKKAIAAVAAIRAKIPAAETAVAAAEKTLREAQQHRMRLEAEMLEAEASTNAVERRTRATLLETAPACIDAFVVAEVDARIDALRLRSPNTITSNTRMGDFLGAPATVDSDIESHGELIRDCVAVRHEAEALKLTVAGEADALAAIAKLRTRIERSPELRRVFPRPERAA